MPSLADTLERAIFNAHLSSEQIDELFNGLKSRAWLPGVHLSFTSGRFGERSTQTTTVTNPTETTTVKANGSYEGSVQLIWELPDLVVPSYNFNPVRGNLYDLRKRFAFVVEDAYLERRQVLSQFVNGGLDTEQFLTLQARLEVLDIILHEFTSGPTEH
jgi:hypothetical protein